MRSRQAFQYERRGQRPLEPRVFVGRFLVHFLLAQVIVFLSLVAGMLGYHRWESLGWTDAFLNAAMLLGGMGPVNAPTTQAGKLFAGAYALYAGLVFLVVAGIMVAPVAHRILHRFHVQDDAA